MIRLMALQTTASVKMHEIEDERARLQMLLNRFCGDSLSADDKDFGIFDGFREVRGEE